MKLHVVLLSAVCLLFGIFSVFSQDLIIEDGEKFIFNVTTGKGETYTSENQFHVKKVNDYILYSYTNEDEYEKWVVETAENGVPTTIEFFTKGNETALTFHGNGDAEIHGFWSGKEINEKGSYSANVSLENALIVRTLDYSSKEKYAFDLLQTSKLPRLVAFPMYFKVLGKEEITVPAGTFSCVKVQFSLTDMRGLFYKAYYYISDDTHRYIVKIHNVPMGGETELVSIN